MASEVVQRCINIAGVPTDPHEVSKWLRYDVVNENCSYNTKPGTCDGEKEARAPAAIPNFPILDTENVISN